MKKRTYVVAVLACASAMFGCGSPAIELLWAESRGNDAGADTAPDRDVSGAASKDAGAHEETAPEPPKIEGMLSLRIEPAALTVSDDGVDPSESSVAKAIGTFAEGERDVTSEVLWSLEDGKLGTVQGGTVTSTGLGGKTALVARANDLTSSAEVVFRLDIKLNASGTPPWVEPRFTQLPGQGQMADAATLELLYPNHETMLPLNLSPPLNQWRAAAELDAFELRFESEFALVRVYTDQRKLSVEPALWQKLVTTHAGKSLSVVVRATTQLSTSAIVSTRPRTLYFSESAVRGALYYWSSGAQGIMRATLNAPIATKFFPGPGAPKDTCAACHTLSRDGRRMALGYNGELLREVSVPDRTVQLPADANAPGVSYGWGTFNPTATRLLYASKGKLAMIDADSGKKLFDVTLPKDTLANYPDWSPDGKWVVAAVGTGRFNNKEVTGTSIARFAVNADGSLGPATTILQSSAPDDTMYFPTFAPDSATIAFVRAKGKSKDNPSARLFLMPADGSGKVQELARLDQRVGTKDGVTGLGNTMPTWAPSTTANTYWLAFSSIRDYGDVIVGKGLDQLWGAAIDRTKIGTAEDPSFAAFWLPFQQTDESNHRAFWTADTGDDGCPNNPELCDLLDNNCNGVIDENCCTPQAEVCANDLDEDCDGTPDDGCNCSQTEICKNNVDDDCDGLMDANDEDCGSLL